MYVQMYGCTQKINYRNESVSNLSTFFSLRHTESTWTDFQVVTANLLPFYLEKIFNNIKKYIYLYL